MNEQIETPVCDDECTTAFLIHYQHVDCPVEPGVQWSQTWCCPCNDRCPACNREIEPLEYKELTAA